MLLIFGLPDPAKPVGFVGAIIAARYLFTCIISRGHLCSLMFVWNDSVQGGK